MRQPIRELFLDTSLTFKDIASLFTQIGFVLSVESGNSLIAVHIETMNKGIEPMNHQWKQFMSYQQARYFAVGYMSCMFQNDL